MKRTASPVDDDEGLSRRRGPHSAGRRRGQKAEESEHNLKFEDPFADEEEEEVIVDAAAAAAQGPDEEEEGGEGEAQAFQVRAAGRSVRRSRADVGLRRRPTSQAGTAGQRRWTTTRAPT